MTNIENSRNCLRRLIHDDQEFSNQSIINVIERFVKSVNIMEETILIPSRLMDRHVGDATDTVKPAIEKSHHHQRHHHYHNKKNLSSNDVRDHLGNTDLFNLYSMLNSVKVDLLWGRSGQEAEETTDITTRNSDSTSSSNDNNNMTETTTKLDTVSSAAAAAAMPSPPPAVAASSAATTTTTVDTQNKGHVRRPSTVSVSSSNSSTISDSESEVSSNENDSGIESENQQNKERSLEIAKQFRTHLLGLYKSLEQMTEAASYLTARYQSDMGGC